MKNIKTGKKKIIITEYFVSLGGGQVVLLNMVKNLKKYFDVQVVLFNRGPLERELLKLGVKPYFIQSPKTVKHRYFWDSAPFLIKLARYFQKEKPAVVFANNFFSVKLSAGAAKINGVPLIWHKHVIIEKDKNSYLAGQLRLYAGLVDKIICVSQAVKRAMVAIGVPVAKLETVYNGIERQKPLVKEARLIRKKHKLGKSFVFGVLGFIRKNKGFDIFVKAAEVVLKKEKNVKFLVVGKAEKADEQFETDLKKYTKDRGLKKNIIFTGYGEKQKYMSAFNVFVLPSLSEPFGLVTIEAMAMGLPVIAFETGGTPEIISNGVDGFLIKDISKYALAEKMLEVYKKKNKIGKIKLQAMVTIKNRFTADRQAEKIKEIIENVISGN